MLSNNKLRQFARLGQRGAYGQSMLLIAESNEDLFCLSADLGNSSGLDRFSSKYGSRYLNLGIAEQHLVGFSAGLSRIGFNCFISSFAPFITMRCAEQIRMNLSYMQDNVKLVGLGSGVSMGYLGNSHFGLEDIGMIANHNNIPIFCPSDTTQLYCILKFLVELKGPAYVRLTGTADTSELIYDTEIDISLGGSSTLLTGESLLILTHGAITHDCLCAIRGLEETRQSRYHLEDVYCIHPIGSKVRRLLKQFKKILIVEEHRKQGGLYSLVSDLVSDMGISVDLRSLALPNGFLCSGDYSSIKANYGLDIYGIGKALKDAVA